MLQLRIISTLMASLLLIPFYFAAAHAGKFENDRRGKASNYSNYIELTSYRTIAPELLPGQNDIKSCAGMDLVEPVLLSHLPRSQDESGIYSEVFRAIDRATPTKRDSLSNRRDNKEFFTSHLADDPGLGNGPLFIIGPILRGRNGLPDSPTMLLIGMGLIGLAACGGRKKFKRQ
jgi:hypothetical protein